jgi:hypothetical protein
MNYKNLDQVLFMQAHIVNLFCRTQKLSPQKFLEIDRKCDFLGYVAESYEIFHLTGDEGILGEMTEYVKNSGML